VDHQGSFGITPIIWSAEHGNVSAVELLARHKANVNARTSEGHTALMWASMNGHYRCIQTLLQFRADITLDFTRSGWAAIHYAAWKGHAECVALLVRHGDDINRETRSGDTPLDCVISNHGLQSKLRSECEKSLKLMGATSGRLR
jgi:ankyrin repeat protein